MSFVKALNDFQSEMARNYMCGLKKLVVDARTYNAIWEELVFSSRYDCGIRAGITITTCLGSVEIINESSCEKKSFGAQPETGVAEQGLKDETSC